MSTTTPLAAADELRFRLRGGLFVAGDAEYDDCCTLFSSAIDKRPRYVARCSAPDDVAAALAFARDAGLAVAVRGGGHSVVGASLVDDGLVIDTRGMTDIAVDAERRVARVGSGCTWAQVDRATQEHGLAAVGGRVSTTGVAGLTLGGGSGWLERKHGLACDNLLAAELVTADGAIVRASEDENPELLWALRGGGGNFGVVTALEFKLHPVPATILAGLAVWPASRSAEILRLFRDVMDAAPEELGLAFASITAPAEDEIPEHLHNQPAVAILGMYNGPVDEGERALAAVRGAGPAVDFFEPTTYADFQCSIDDPPGYRNYWTAELLPSLPDEAIATTVAMAAHLPAGPSQVFIVPWGGAVARAHGTAVSGRDARYIVHPLILWEDAEADEAMIRLGRSFRSGLAPFAGDSVYLNFVGDEGEERTRRGFGAAYERLARVKAQWDPDGVFTGNHPVS